MTFVSGSLSGDSGNGTHIADEALLALGVLSLTSETQSKQQNALGYAPQ